MKVKRGDIERVARDQPPELRLILLHGPDAAGSAELAGTIVRGAGAEVEKVSLSSASLKAEPALLADEAASFSLFGGRRVIVAEGGEELLGAVEALLASPPGGNLAIAIAGALRKGSKLLAAAEASPRAMACVSYVPEGREADRVVAEMARKLGLSVAPAVAHRVAEAGSGDRSLIAQELSKFALFLDAAPDRPATLDPEVVAVLSADADEGDISRLVDAVVDGDAAALDNEMGHLAAGSEVPLVRAVGRRLLLLARNRSEVERGSSVAAVMASAGKSLFPKDRPAVERQLGQWNGKRLSSALGRMLTAEREMKKAAGIGGQAATEALYALARSVAQRR